MDEDEGVLSLPNEIPYKKIQSLTVEEVSTKGEEFIIQLSKKCEDLHNEDGYQIIRKVSDFVWVISQLHKEHPQNFVLPIFPAEASYFEQLTAIIGGMQRKQKTEIHLKEKNRVNCKIIERFFQIINQLCLKNIYKVPNSIKSSLFVFLDEQDKVYRTQIFDIEENQENTVSWLANTGKKLFKALNIWKKGQKRHFESEEGSFKQTESEIREFIECLRKYEESLIELSQNFAYKKREIQDKDIQVYTVLKRAEFLLYYINRIETEIRNTLTAIESHGSLVEESQIQLQVDAYCEFLKKDHGYIVNQLNKILREFFTVCVERTVSIDLNEILLDQKG